MSKHRHARREAEREAVKLAETIGARLTGPAGRDAAAVLTATLRGDETAGQATDPETAAALFGVALGAMEHRWRLQGVPEAEITSRTAEAIAAYLEQQEAPASS